MMAKKSSALAGIFDDDATTPEPAPAPTPIARAEPAPPATPRPSSRASAAQPAKAGASRNHGTKKPVLIHIPEDMHRLLRRISVEEGEPLTAITERMLRQYLVSKGHTKFAP